MLIAFAFTCKHPYACIQYLYCHCVLLGTTSDACPHLTFQSKDPEAPNSKTLLKAQNTEAFLWKTDAGINAPSRSRHRSTSKTKNCGGLNFEETPSKADYSVPSVIPQRVRKPHETKQRHSNTNKVEPQHDDRKS